VRGGGSRACLSPQQVAGEPAQPADDLYALGALLFELLSGHPPFPKEASDDEIRLVPPPPVASPVPVPDALRALVASLLAKTPEAGPLAAAARQALRRSRRGWAGRCRPRGDRPSVCKPPPRVSPAAVVPAELRDRVDRLASRPARAGLSAGQVTLLAALGVAVVVAVAWLPRWAQAPVAPSPTPIAPTDAPTPADPPAVPALTALPPAEATPSPPAADPPVEPPPARSRPPVGAAPRESPPAPDVPAQDPAPTPDRLAEAAALSRHRDAARALEQREDWRAALAEYEAALAVDPHVTFGLEGKERAAGRAALADGLDFHARNAHRL
jgi:serine/threonine-protein kinase